MRYFLFFACFLAVVFTGCAKKNENTLSTQMEQAIVSTKKARLELGDRSTLLLTATYLNSIKRFSSNENDTIVLSYHYLPQKSAKIGEMKVKLNGKAVSFSEVNADDEMVKSTPNNNMWSRYFVINLPKNDETTILLTVEIYPFSEARLNLSKAP